MSVPTSSRTGSAVAGSMPPTGGVERELADRDAHAAGALVAEAEDALAVGDDDDLGLVEWRVAENLPDASRCGMLRKSPRGLRNSRLNERAAGADRRRVDDRQQFLDVALEQRVKQRLVGVLQVAQESVALEIGGEFAERLQPPAHLLVDAGNRRRQQPVQAEDVALVVAEGRALVQPCIRQQLIAGQFRRHGDCVSAIVAGRRHLSRRVYRRRIRRWRKCPPWKRSPTGSGASLACAAIA